MAQSVIGSLRVNLGLDSAQFARGAKGVDAPLKRMRQQFVAVAGVATIMGGAIAAAALAGAKQIDEAAKSARRLDASIGGFRALELAASEAGVSLSGLTNDIQTMNRELASIGTSGNGQRALEALGLTIDDLEGKDADEKLAIIADQVKALGLNAGETTAILRDLGVRNREMALLVLSGGDAIRSARGDIQEYGLAISAVDASRIETANDQIGRLGLIAQYAGQQLAVALVPAMGAFAESMTDSLREGGLLRAVIDGLVDNLDRLAVYGTAAVVIFGTRYVAALVAAKGATLSFALALRTVRGALISTGIGALVVLAGELAFQIYELVLAFSRLVKAAGGFGEALVLLKGVALGVWDKIKAGGEVLYYGLALTFNNISNTFVEMLGAMAQNWAKFSDSIAETNIGEMMGLEGGDAQKVQLQYETILNGLADSSFELSGALGDAKSRLTTTTAGMDELRAAMATANEEIEAVVDATTDLSGGLDDVEDAATGGGAGGAAGALTETADAAAEAASAFNDKLATAVDGVASAFGDWVASGFQDFKGMVDNILNSFKSMISQMIATAVANPIKLALGIGGGGAAGAVAGGGGGSILGNIGLGGGLAGSFMSGGAGLVTSMMGGGGLASAGTYMSAVMGGATSSMAGFAAAAGAVALPLLAVAAVFLAFRKTTKELDAGVRISVEGMETLVEGYKKIQTSRFFGLSKKVGDEFEAMDAAIADPMQNAVNGVLSNVFDMATGLGVAASEFDAFTTSLIVSTKGMTDEQAQVAVADALRDIGVEFAGMATDLFEFQRHGENAAMILQRLSTSVAASNVVMSALGLTLFDLTLGGANAASVFNDAFGSLENLNAISSNYYAKAYTDVERVGAATKAMSGAMSELGAVMPKTVAGFRNLIEQADRMGDMDKVADLLILFGDFATMVEGQTAIAKASLQDQSAIASAGLTAANSNLTKATTDLNAAFSREMAATRDAFQVTIDGLNDDLTGARARQSNSKSIADALSGALDRRLFPSVEAQRQSQDAAAGYLASLVGLSRIDDVDALQNALGIVADPSVDTYETLEDYRRDFGMTSGVIRALEKTAGFALSADEQAVNLLETQIENTQLQSDTQIGLLQAQLDGILGLSSSLMSVGSAVSGFAAAQASQTAATAAATAATAAVANISLGPIEQIYKDVLGRTADAVGLAFYRGNLSAGNSSLDQIRANISASTEAATFNSTGIARLPSFDGGGYTGNGSRTGGLDGQGGFMAMMHPQETVTDHTRGGGNARMEAQLERMNTRIEQLTAYQKQTTINTGNASFDLKDMRRNGVQVEPVTGAIFKTDEVA
jgi:hypothetical protein